MLRLNHMSYQFPGTDQPILKDLNFELLQGDFCVLIGSNGSGKSTLMKLISGEYQPTVGSIDINGPKSQNRRIAEVVQDVTKGTISAMTLFENMCLSEFCSKKTRFAFHSRHQQQHRALIKKLGLDLENHLDQPISHLSGGQRQMLATLMALNSDPMLLLLDEHTSALDPAMSEKVMRLTVEAVISRQLTTVMITHKLEDAIQYGNRLVMLDCGEIVLDVRGQEKSSLGKVDLLQLFYQFENKKQLTEAL